MRVGIVCHHGFGGSVRTAVHLACALARRGHGVDLLSRRVPLGSARLGPGVTVHALAVTGGPSAILQTEWPARELSDFEAMIAGADARGTDVIHFHYGLPFAEIVSSLRPSLRAALVGTFHGTDVETAERDASVARRLRAAARDLDAVTTVSRAYAARVRRVLGVDPIVIPNFVDLDVFRPALQRTRTRPVIVHVSNFRPVKDPESLVRVGARAMAAVDAELWLVGDGPGLATVRTELARRGLRDRVRAFGLQADVAPLLERSDVMLLTSRAESFSIAALEAAAAGLAVVAPRVGGIDEVVRDGATGILYEPRDETAAVAALTMLLSDEPVRARMGRAARARAAAFRVDAIVPRYLNLYRAVLSAGVLREAAR